MPPTRSGPGVDRRTLLRNAALLGISVPTLNALLAACADAPTGSGGTGGGASGGALQIASPDNPVTWDITDDNQPIDDGLPPEAGPLLLYNYADYIGPGVVKSFEEQYGVEVKISTFNDTDEAITKIRTGAVPVRHLLPQLRPDRPAGDRAAGAAAQPQLPRQPRQRLGRLPEPVVRRRGPLLGALQRLHDRGRLAHRPGARRHRRARQPLRRAVGPGVRRQGRRSSTTGTPRWRWSGCAPASPTSTPTIRDDLATHPAEPDRAEPRRSSPRSRSRCTTTCPRASSASARCGRATSSTRSTTCPRAQSVDVLRYWFPDDGMGLVDNDLMMVLTRRQQPRPRPPLPRAHARREELAEELRLHRLPAARRRCSTPSGSSPTATCRRTSPPPPCARSGSTPATGCSSSTVENDAAWHRVWQQFKAGA